MWIFTFVQWIIQSNKFDEEWIEISIVFLVFWIRQSKYIFKNFFIDHQISSIIEKASKKLLDVAYSIFHLKNGLPTIFFKYKLIWSISKMKLMKISFKFKLIWSISKKEILSLIANSSTEKSCSLDQHWINISLGFIIGWSIMSLIDQHKIVEVLFEILDVSDKIFNKSFRLRNHVHFDMIQMQILH